MAIYVGSKGVRRSTLARRVYGDLRWQEGCMAIYAGSESVRGSVWAVKSVR